MQKLANPPCTVAQDDDGLQQRSRVNSIAADPRKESNTFQSNSMVGEEEQRPLHPLLQVIDDVVGQRIQALHTAERSKKPSIKHFIQRFEEQMIATEHAYKQFANARATEQNLY